MAPTQAPYSAMRDLKWSPAEKTIAHKAFDLALRREIDVVIREAKDRAAGIEHPSELWDLERWLTQRRKEIDGKFDFRYSVLPVVFGNLLREGCLTEQDLHGLEQDKLGFIRRFSNP
jgi:hypothetical protein